MSGVVRHYGQPQWSASMNWDFASSVLAKVAEYSPSADSWRPLRSDDIPGATVDTWANTVATVAATWTTMIPVAAGFRVPQGLGIGFYGFWIAGADLGVNAGYRILINSVKRVICPIHEFMADSQYARVGLQIGTVHTGLVYYFQIHYEHPDQLCFAQENDLVAIQLYAAVVLAIGTFEFFPLAIVAGNGKQLLIDA